MDTKYWGPSGWVLLHTICHYYEPANRPAVLEFLSLLPFILPCKFCRHSLSTYYESDPPEEAPDLSRWIWRIHNQVNNKLRAQGQAVPANPSYDTIKKRYDSCPQSAFPGWDFLFSVAETHPASKLVKNSKPMPDAPPQATTPEERNKWNLMTPEERWPFFQRFWASLPAAFPYREWQAAWLAGPPLDLTSRPALLRTLWALRNFMCERESGSSFKELCSILKDQRSGCGVSHRARTCRKKRNNK